MTLKAITIALVCGTAQAGYSISSMLMIAFLNKHMNFYASYLHMIADFHLQFFQQYFLCTPVRKPNSPHAIDAISIQVHARPPDGVARGGGLHALVQVLLRGHYGRRR